MSSEEIGWEAMAIKLVAAMTDKCEGGKTLTRLGVITDIFQSTFGLIVYPAQPTAFTPQPQLVVGEPAAVDGKFGLFQFILLAILARDEVNLPAIKLPQDSPLLPPSSSYSNWSRDQGPFRIHSEGVGLAASPGVNRITSSSSDRYNDTSTEDTFYDVGEPTMDWDETMLFDTSIVKITFDMPGYNHSTPRILLRTPTTPPSSPPSSENSPTTSPNPNAALHTSPLPILVNSGPYGGCSGDVYTGSAGRIRLAVKFTAHLGTCDLATESWWYEHLTATETSPHLVKSYGLFTDAVGRAALVMEDGGTAITSFDDLSAENRSGLLALLISLHHHGVVHGDVDPRNVLLDDKGVARLVDFSEARYHECRGLGACSELRSVQRELSSY
ncbi:hypothetical protein FRB94_004575 [Tulasnella sp. JGI-2019a]|nr:hypothetical protein FRB94_004575 [Tulasnella sp. JGI-2019a]